MYALNTSSKPAHSDFLPVFCISLGCPKNRVDTERMLASLGAFQPVRDLSQAGLVLINTCGFIAPAVQESTQTILETAQLLRDLDSRPLLAVTGCLVSRYGVELRHALPEVDIWLGVHEEHLLAERIRTLSSKPVAFPKTAPNRVLSTMPAYAYLKVGEGCNHRCRFCTIPAIRGRLRSSPVQTLCDEARAILDQGVSELVLVAQDLTAYGRDLGLRHGLESLVAALCRLDGLRWLRLMYLYPAGLTTRLLHFLADQGLPLLPYFDVPLQHAHLDILAAMGRPFRRDPRQVVDRIRRHLPEACLRTSLIVGFPGERPHHFRALRTFVHEARFDHLGVFSFCPESGTPAAALSGQIGVKTKTRRREELMALQAQISTDLLRRWQDQDVEILVERASPEWPGLFEGRAWFQAPEVDGVSYVSGAGVAPGRIVRAQVQDTMAYDLAALADPPRDRCKPA